MRTIKKPKPVTVDFEALKIQGRPTYPPVPVGVSIKLPGKKAKYYAWGHPTKNNCDWATAEKALRKVWDCKDGLLFQNAKFDLDVAEVHFGLPIPSWDRIHDTMFLLFLDDPHQSKLALKPAAERLLGWPAEEQDAVKDWLLENQPIPGVKISASQSSDHYFGAYTAYAPGDLVAKYADGDTDRTAALFDLLYEKTVSRGMLESYNRERKLLPILLEMERQGLPVNLKKLRSDVAMYNDLRGKIDAWIMKRIKAPDDINLNSGAQLINAMIASGKADPDQMPLTATGKIQTNKEALLAGVTDKVLLAMLKYRSQLNTCLDTFMVPWLRTAEKSSGYIFTLWNQTRSPKGADNVGTRTGRLSSTPNFQNIPNEFKPIWKGESDDAGVNSKLPKAPFVLPQLPKVRSYVVPFDGHVIIDRDYSQQEPRILAHFDGGSLLDKYIEHPWIDFHDYAKEELEKMGKYYDRKPVKNTNLGLIYGMGVGKLAERNDMSVQESSQLKKAIQSLYPGLKEMYKDMKIRARNNQPIRTWGGREYFCEPPKIVNGRIMEFDYKMVNVLIQGSAADCTKEAIIRYHAIKHPEARIILNVHDQITVSVPKKIYKQEMEALRKAMESIEFDVPMLSEGSWSDKNWDSLIDYDKKGEIVK